MTIAFEEAVQIATTYLMKERYDGELDLYSWKGAYRQNLERIAPLFMKGSFPVFHDGTNPLQVSDLSKHPHTFEKYSQFLDPNDPLGFDLMRHGLAQLIENGDKIPEEIREAAAGIMSGNISAPKRQAGNKSKAYLHSRIVWAVAILEKQGMTATRNDASPPLSACDAVAAALAALGLRPKTGDQVIDIWHDGKWVVAVGDQLN